MEQVSLYLSEPKAGFTLKYESVAVKLSLDQSIEEAHEPNLSSPSLLPGAKLEAVADQSGR